MRKNPESEEEPINSASDSNPQLHEARIAAAAATRTTPAPEVVQIMGDRRAQGDTLRQIAEGLNRLEIRTPRGFRWYAETVRNQLASFFDLCT